MAMNQTEAHDLLWTKYLDASMRLHDLERYLEHTQDYLHREQTYYRDEAHPDLAIGGRRFALGVPLRLHGVQDLVQHRRGVVPGGQGEAEHPLIRLRPLP